MADVSSEEPVVARDGREIVDIRTADDGDSNVDSIRDKFQRQFSRVVLVTTDQNENPVSKVELAECKICGALLRLRVAPLLTHARRHNQERRTT